MGRSLARSSSLGRRVLTVGAGTALAQLVAAGSTPLLTRLYPPNAHAAWAIYLSVCVILSGLATLRYELAVVLPADRSRAAELAVVAVAVAAIVSALASPALWLLGPHFMPAEQIANLRIWCWLVPLSVFSTAVYQVASAWCTREADFKTYSIAQFMLPITTVISQLALAYAGHRNGLGLIAGMAFGQFVIALVLFVHVWRRSRSVFQSTAHSAVLVESAKEYRRYPLYMAPYTIVGMSRERLAYFLLGRFGNPESAGYYGLMARFVNLPNSFIASSVRPVFFQHAAGRKPAELERPMLETMQSLGIVSVLVWAPCAVQAHWLCGFVFGLAWVPAAPYAVALSIPAIPLLIGNWADRMFDVLGRQKTALAMELLFSCLAMSGLLIGYFIWHNLLWAIWVQSLLLTVYYFGWLMFLFRLAGFQVAPLARAIVKILITGAVAWAICLFTGNLLPPLPAFSVTITVAAVIAGMYGVRRWRNIRASVDRVPNEH